LFFNLYKTKIHRGLSSLFVLLMQSSLLQRLVLLYQICLSVSALHLWDWLWYRQPASKPNAIPSIPTTTTIRAQTNFPSPTQSTIKVTHKKTDEKDAVQVNPIQMIPNERTAAFYKGPNRPLTRLRNDTSLPTGAAPKYTDEGFLMLPRPLVPLSDLINGRRYFLYAQAARCVSLSDFFQWSCGPYCNDYKYGTKGSHMVASFKDDATLMRGMIAIHPFREEIIIGFRASERLSDFTNFNVKLWGTKTDLWNYGKSMPHNVTIHKGYNIAYTTIREQVIEEVVKVQKKYPRHKLVFTGHSMGGALASIALIDVKEHLRIPARQLALYTFGSPPVGSLAFRQLFRGIESFRYVNRGDWVSRIRMLLPSRLWNHLYHVGREIYVTRLDARFAEHAYLCNESLGEDDDKVCSSGESNWLVGLSSMNSEPHSKYCNSLSGIEHCHPVPSPTIWR
jgi:hypothetical protein